MSNFNILKTNTFSACWVIWCFHSPPNSDVDYRIRNMHIWLFCMHICCFCTHHHITFDEVEIHKNLRTGMHITCDRLQKCCVCVTTCKEKKKIVQNLHWSDSLHAQSRINLSLLARYLRPLRHRVNNTCVQTLTSKHRPRSSFSKNCMGLYFHLCLHYSGTWTACRLVKGVCLHADAVGLAEAQLSVRGWWVALIHPLVSSVWTSVQTRWSPTEERTGQGTG